ncbi:MAG: NAD-dependent epimerase/dehydratase family protein, partial [Bryobacteraceae bacterium]
MQGVEEVYHLAGFVSRDPADAGLMYKVHVDGTRYICEAARVRQCRKVVVVSSSGTIAVSREPVVHNESSGYKHEVVAEWPYYLSKIYTEKVALHYARESGLPVVIANPSLLLGPGDDRGSSTGDVALFLDGQLMAMPQGGMSFVDVRDVAAALIQAMRVGRPGERYLLGGPNWTFRELVLKLAGISGVSPPKIELGMGASLASAKVMRKLSDWTGRQLRGLDEASIKMSALFWYCDPAKAVAELGFRARDPMATLQDTVNDLRQRRAQPV